MYATTTKKVPRLRFRGFSGEWQEKKLGDVAEVKGGKRIPKGYSLLDESNGLPYITVSGMVNGGVDMNQVKFVPNVIANAIKNYTISSDDIYVSVAGTLGLIGTIPRALDGANLTENANKLTNLKVDRNYLLQLLKSDRFKKLVKNVKTDNAQPKLAIYAIKDFTLYVPKPDEQEKIAGFLTAVDSKISALQGKNELLRKYKKSAMQAIFSQKIRFKDGNGKNYPAWQEKKLGELGKTYNGLIGKTALDFGKGFPFITYKQIFDDAIIDKAKFAFVKINSKDKQNTAKCGDIFFTTSSETPLEVGFASVLLDNIENLYLNSFCFGYRVNLQSMFSPKFAQFLFRSPHFRRFIIKLAQGSTRFNMSKIELMKIVISLPSIEEQEKIADYLTSLDNKINLTERKLEQAKRFKSSLLQQMFV